jgi:hypothetical protein
LPWIHIIYNPLRILPLIQGTLLKHLPLRLMEFKHLYPLPMVATTADPRTIPLADTHHLRLGILHRISLANGTRIMLVVRMAPLCQGTLHHPPTVVMKPSQLVDSASALLDLLAMRVRAYLLGLDYLQNLHLLLWIRRWRVEAGTPILEVEEGGMGPRVADHPLLHHQTRRKIQERLVGRELVIMTWILLLRFVFGLPSSGADLTCLLQGDVELMY